MKVWIILLAALLVGSNLYWAGRSMDTGLNQAENRQEQQDTLGSLDAAIILANLNLIGMAAEDARMQINRVWNNAQLVEKTDGCIYTRNLCIQLDAAGNVIEIRKQRRL